MKRRLLALTLLIALPLAVLAQETYETPLQSLLKSMGKTNGYTTLSVSRGSTDADEESFFIAYNINAEGNYSSAIMFNQASIGYVYEEGKLMQEVFSIPGSASYINTYIYNAKGQLTEKRIEFKAPDAEPTLSEIVAYTYNANGRLDTAKISDAGETPESTTEINFTYNEDGSLKEAITFKIIGKQVYKTFESYSYDKQGRLTQCNENNISGEMMDGDLVWYDDIGEQVTKTYTYTEDDKVVEKTEGRGNVYYMIYVFNK